MHKIDFNGFYREQYGERWDNLAAAMLSEEEDKASIDGLLEPYFMDRTSIETAMLLPIEEGLDVLDMCAAPGGKSIVIASRLKGSGSLVSNDRSPDRRGRMRKAFETSLPEDWRSNITITGHDASKWGVYEKEAYDRILLDAQAQKASGAAVLDDLLCPACPQTGWHHALLHMLDKQRRG